jgi:HlyD family secretion protein
MRRLRTWAIAAVVVVAVGAALWLWSRRAPAAETTSYSQVVAVERGDLVASVALTGEVSAERRSALSFDVTRIALLELNVAAGQQVREGEILARIEPDSLQRAVDQAEADLLSQEEALLKAQAPYTDLDREKAELDVALAEAAALQAQQSLDALADPEEVKKAVREAEYNLQSARLNWTMAQHSSTTGKAVRDLRYTVAWHERALRNLEAQLAEGKVELQDVDDEVETLSRLQTKLAAAESAAQASLLAAQERVIEAEEELADLQGGTDDLALAQARHRVAQAQYNLAKAQETLSDILAGPDPKSIQLAQSRYDAAKATLEDAQEALTSATMVAPFDATIISVGAEVGDLVSSNNTIVTVADLSRLQITASVDETDISKVEIGQEAQITFDAFPGLRLSGTVLEIPLEGRLAQNVVTYEVPVSMESVQGVAIKPGMTANLSIVVGRTENALLIPALAVLQSDEGNVVLVQDSIQGEGTTTPVETGLSDGTYVEVLRGLIEGDHVLVKYQASDQQFSMGGMRGLGIGGQFFRR